MIKELLISILAFILWCFTMIAIFVFMMLFMTALPLMALGSVAYSVYNRNTFAGRMEQVNQELDRLLVMPDSPEKHRRVAKVTKKVKKICKT